MDGPLSSRQISGEPAGKTCTLNGKTWKQAGEAYDGHRVAERYGEKPTLCRAGLAIIPRTAPTSFAGNDQRVRVMPSGRPHRRYKNDHDDADHEPKACRREGDNEQRGKDEEEHFKSLSVFLQLSLANDIIFDLTDARADASRERRAALQRRLPKNTADHRCCASRAMDCARKLAIL